MIQLLRELATTYTLFYVHIIVNRDISRLFMFRMILWLVCNTMSNIPKFQRWYYADTPLIAPECSLLFIDLWSKR